MTLGRPKHLARVVVIIAMALPALGAAPDDRPGADPPQAAMRINVPVSATADAAHPAAGAWLFGSRQQAISAAQTVGLFAGVSLGPAAVLMITAFVRISIVLTLLRQALGSPQVPGNQVLMALALLLTALVMKPEAEAVYARAIVPYRAGRLSEVE